MEYISGTNRGQLIDITHKDKGSPGWNGFQEVVHQDGVDHGGFIYNQKITPQRGLIVFLESSFLDTVFQQAVDSLGLVTGSLAHPFRSSARRSSQQYFNPTFNKDFQM